MFVSVAIEVPKERRVALVSKVLGTNLFFKFNWDMDLESSAVWHPTDPWLVLRSREDFMDLFRERHVPNGIRKLVVFWFGHLGEIKIRMVGRSPSSANDLNASRSGGKGDLGRFPLGH